MVLIRSRRRIYPVDEKITSEDINSIECKEYESFMSINFSEFDVLNIARNVLHSIQTVSPNWLDREKVDPVQFHPIFCGCYDWHSAVHSHWTLLNLVELLEKEHINLADNKKAEVMEFIETVSGHFNSAFTAEKINKEILSIDTLTANWECPYGFAWFVKLYSFMHHFHSTTLTNCSVWVTNLSSLSNVIEKRLHAWLMNLQVAYRKGWHENTAFSLKMIVEVCHYGFFPSLQSIAFQKSEALFGEDRNIVDVVETCPFLSPSLCEADLMSYYYHDQHAARHQGTKILLSAEDWLQRAINDAVWNMKPNDQGDPEDGYKSHLCGLNFSRSYNLSSIACTLLSNPDFAAQYAQEKEEQLSDITITFLSNMIQSAVDHYNYAIPSLATGHFMGDHWLASFAVRARSGLQCLQTALACHHQWVEFYRQYTTTLISFPTLMTVPVVRGWTTVRVFISSTFDDMHQERDVLMKQLFPTLSKWAEPLKIKIVPVELSKDVMSKQDRFTACMSEIDRCQLLGTNGLFISMLSERYGKVCSIEDIPEDIRRKYGWTDDVSLTHMEILHGALCPQNLNACFLFRDPTYLVHIPPSQIHSFIDPPTEVVKVTHLKNHIRANVPAENVFSYSYTVNNKMECEQLPSFVASVTEFVQRRLLALFPKPIELSSREMEEEQAHQAALSVHTRGNFVLGRDHEVQEILSYFLPSATTTSDLMEEEGMALFTQLDIHQRGILKKQELMVYFHSLVMNNNSNISDTEIWNMMVTNYSVVSEEQTEFDCIAFCAVYEQFCLAWSHPYTLLGEVGSGKSTVICKAIQEFKHIITSEGEWIVITHFVGSTPGSTSIQRLIMRIGQALEGSSWQPPIDQHDLRNCLPTLLLRASMKGTKVAIFLDALNQLDDNTDGTVHALHWLPHWLPPNIMILVSCVEPSNCLTTLQARKPPGKRQSLGVLSHEVSVALVEHWLGGENNQRLDSNQMRSLLTKEEAGNPLYLRIACHEIRVFGLSNEFLTNKILMLSNELSGLYTEVISRLIETYGARMLLTLCMIERSRHHGISEDVLVALLRDPSIQTSFTVKKQSSHDKTTAAATLLNELIPSTSTAMTAAASEEATEWSMLILALQEFVGSVSVDGRRYAFYHHSFANAVRRDCYLDTPKEEVEAVDDEEEEEVEIVSPYFTCKGNQVYKKETFFFAKYFDISTDTLRHQS